MSLDERMARLNALAERLNRETDEVKRDLLDVEERLVANSIGIEADVEIEQIELPGGERSLTTYVCYGRYQGKFRIHLRHDTHEREEDEDGDVTYRQVDSVVFPWQNATREQKHAAHAKLPELLEAIEATAERMIAERERASALLRAGIPPGKIVATETTPGTGDTPGKTTVSYVDPDSPPGKPRIKTVDLPPSKRRRPRGE